MNAIFHAINIGTLATWLSVTGFGTVAGLIPVWHPETRKPKVLDALPVSQDFILGTEEPSNNSPLDSPPESSDQESTNLPAPPELPSLAESEPLPEIPNLPVPKPADTPAPLASKPTPRPAVSSKPATSSRPNTSARSAGSGSGANKAASSTSFMSNSARIAAGRMGKPPYPSSARRNNQTGTVLVEFTVDASGRVISAYVKSSSNWPLLDNQAVRTVRSWKFPPGKGFMTERRPITFRLE